MAKLLSQPPSGRLADVIGPRDTTNRWWTYQLWVQFFPEIQKPVYMPAHVADKVGEFRYLLLTGIPSWSR